MGMNSKQQRTEWLCLFVVNNMGGGWGVGGAGGAGSAVHINTCKTDIKSATRLCKAERYCWQRLAWSTWRTVVAGGAPPHRTWAQCCVSSPPWLRHHQESETPQTVLVNLSWQGQRFPETFQWFWGPENHKLQWCVNAYLLFLSFLTKGFYVFTFTVLGGK